MQIEIISPNEVRQDGQNMGAVADCIANHPKLASDIQRALVVYDAALKKSKSDTEAELTALKKTVTDGITAIKSAVLDANTPTEETVLAIIADATKSERQKQADELRAQKADIEAQIAALVDPPPPINITFR